MVYQRVKAVSESDLRMLGNLARNIQRVLPVTQADIDAAAALGKGWVVWKVVEVNDPIDNLRGGTQLVIKQNSVQPGQNVRRVLIVQGPGGETVVVRGSDYIALPDAIADSLQYVKAFGGTEQRNLPDGYIQRQFIYMMDGSYVDTGIVPDNAGKIEIDFQTTSVQTRNTVYLGARTNTSTGAGVAVAHTNTAEGVFDAFGQRFSPTQTFDNNTRYLISYDNGTIVWKSGSTVIYTNTTTPTDTTTHSLYINALNNAGTVYGNYEGIYLYSFKVWNAQGVLVADYVPAIQKGTVPVVGFYDTVSGTFKTATAGTFAAGGEAVPTPDAPMDIVSNNGVLKARHASGLPLGYTLLDYIESSGTQYIDTGIIANNSTGFYVDAQKLNTAPDAIVIGSRESNSNTRCWVDIDHSNNGVLVFGWGDSKRSPNIIGTNRFQAFLNFMNSRNGIVDGQECPDFATLLQSSLPTQTRNLYLFRANYSGGDFPFVGKVYSVKISQNDTFARNFIPAKRNSDNVIGMYDTVSGQFFTNAGTGDFVAGDPVSDPVEIYADGVVETIGVRSPNLFDANACTDNYYYNVNLEYMGNPLLALSDYIPVTAGRTYTISGNTSITLTLRINFFDSNKTIISQTAVGNLSGDYNETFTVPAGISYVRYSFDKTQKNSQKVSYMTSTATAEMLLSLGDYTDEQEIISGVVTRKLGVKVLDGTETGWSMGSSSFYISNLVPDAIGYSEDNPASIFSHFQGVQPKVSIADMPDGSAKLGASSQQRRLYFKNNAITSVSDWTDWLANQYAAGTPVIIVYPLATETTDTVTGQPMNTTAGDNILEITQASLDGLELEAKYQKSA